MCPKTQKISEKLITQKIQTRTIYFRHFDEKIRHRVPGFLIIMIIPSMWLYQDYRLEVCPSTKHPPMCTAQNRAISLCESIKKTMLLLTCQTMMPDTIIHIAKRLQERIQSP